MVNSRLTGIFLFARGRSSPALQPENRDLGLDAGRRNIPAANPAAPQTAAGAGAHAQHADGLTPASDLIHAAAPVDRRVDDEDSSRTNHNTTNNNTNMSLLARKPTPPHLNLRPHDSGATASAAAPSPTTTTTTTATATATTPKLQTDGAKPNPLLLHKPLPKSPGSASKISSFFGWTASPSSTNFSSDDKASDKGYYSPLPSPFSPKPTTIFTDDSPLSTQGPFITTTKTHALEDSPLGYCESYLQTPPDANQPPPPPHEKKF